MNLPSDRTFDRETVLQQLRRAWSSESSSLWTEDNPAKGHCGVTSLVIQDLFGGEIRKTPLDDGMHFYNYIDGQRYDLTAEQFDALPTYLDLPSNRREAFDDTNIDQYAHLSERFLNELSEE
jgi:hypothetical protein